MGIKALLLSGMISIVLLMGCGKDKKSIQTTTPVAPPLPTLVMASWGGIGGIVTALRALGCDVVVEDPSVEKAVDYLGYLASKLKPNAAGTAATVLQGQVLVTRCHGGANWVDGNFHRFEGLSLENVLHFPPKKKNAFVSPAALSAITPPMGIFFVMIVACHSANDKTFNYEAPAVEAVAASYASPLPSDPFVYIGSKGGYWRQEVNHPELGPCCLTPGAGESFPAAYFNRIQTVFRQGGQATYTFEEIRQDVDGRYDPTNRTPAMFRVLYGGGLALDTVF